MENKLTDNEIIKALECCGAGKYHCLVELCPKFRDNATTTVSECREVLMKDTIDLINRQKAEIERLNRSISTSLKEFWSKIKKYCKREICFFTPQDERELIQFGNNLIKEMEDKNG